MIDEIYLPPRLIEKFKIACEFIQEASIEQRGCLLNELLVFNEFVVWDADMVKVGKVESISIFEDTFQVNVEKEKI